MAEHSHLLRDDLRGPLLPLDGLSHISRINDWQGSDAWVQGCRKDKPMSEGREDYPEPKLPFKLLTNAYHEGAMRKAGEVVYIQPSKRGTQHAKIPGQEYPMLPEPVPPEQVAPRLEGQDAKIDALTQKVEALSAHADSLNDEIDDLKASLTALSRKMADMEAVPKAPAPPPPPKPEPPKADAPKPDAPKTNG